MAKIDDSGAAHDINLCSPLDLLEALTASLTQFLNRLRSCRTKNGSFRARLHRGDTNSGAFVTWGNVNLLARELMAQLECPLEPPEVGLPQPPSVRRSLRPLHEVLQQLRGAIRFQAPGDWEEEISAAKMVKLRLLLRELRWYFRHAKREARRQPATASHLPDRTGGPSVPHWRDLKDIHRCLVGVFVGKPAGTRFLQSELLEKAGFARGPEGRAALGFLVERKVFFKPGGPGSRQGYEILSWPQGMPQPEQAKVPLRSP